MHRLSEFLLLRKETNFAFQFGVGKGQSRDFQALSRTFEVIRDQSYPENILPPEAAPAGMVLLAIRLPTNCP